MIDPTKSFSKKLEGKLKGLLKEAEKLIGGLGISDKERKDIIAAMGGDIRRGAWYKCPNGHIYCIDQCGGAMETGTCPECREQIGGTSHTLLQTNTLAREMDGASTAAWPQGRPFL